MYSGVPTGVAPGAVPGVTTTDPKAFIHIEPQNEAKRPKQQRLGDFKQVYEQPVPETVVKQASRCMNCGVPFCHGDHGCPVDNLIPEWNEMVVKGRWQEAVQRLHQTNNFPEFTGQLCPAPCEAGCVLAIQDRPVTIRQIELAIVNEGFRQGWIRPQPAKLGIGYTGRNIGIVGSGPAGLAAAQQLVRMGHQVVVYEKASLPGGLLRYGIPDFKMEKWVLDRRLQQLRGEGVIFRCGIEIGTKMPLAELMEVHDAIGLTVGAEKPRELPIPGRELSGVYEAMDFLTLQNLHQERKLPGDPPVSARGKKVVILGGGDTGSDCLGTVLRQGAQSVLQFELAQRPPAERSSETPWPHWPLKLRSSHAHEEGGERFFGRATTAFVGFSQNVSDRSSDQSSGGVLAGLTTVEMEVRDGKMVSIPGTERTIEADMVILAIGFTGIPLPLRQSWGTLKTTRTDTLWTDSQWMTSTKGVFAAGDARRGASLIVWAIAEGRKMAESIDRYIR